jgi:hypothetical protein
VKRRIGESILITELDNDLLGRLGELHRQYHGGKWHALTVRIPFMHKTVNIMASVALDHKPEENPS